MAFKLRRAVTVSRLTGDGVTPVLARLQAGVLLDHIPEAELAQLSPDHFVDDEGHGHKPPDWRPQERQDADREFMRRRQEEIDARQARKAAQREEA